MMNAINNHEEDEIRKSKKWVGRTMTGIWDGTGIWHEVNIWSGNGTWEGGLLSGTWDGMGTWKLFGNGTGEWKGKGNLVSNMSFSRSSAKIPFVIALVAVVVIALVAVAAKGLISNELAIGGGIVAVMLLFVGSIVIGERETVKGKWLGEGIWKDEGEFRILDMNGHWKLGYHTGIIKGKMKDHKTKEANHSRKPKNDRV